MLIFSNAETVSWDNRWTGGQTVNLKAKLAFLLSLVVGAGIFSAEAQDFRGALIGTVTDRNGGEISSAELSLKSVDSEAERVATSDSHGAFRFAGLLPGDYALRVKAPGFTDAQATVTIPVSSTREIQI